MLAKVPLFRGPYNSRLDGGAADEDGISSSNSLDRLRLVEPTAPRFAADIFGRSGELL